MLKTIMLALGVVASVLLAPQGAALEPFDAGSTFPARFDALVLAEVQLIEHSLRTSDARRVEHGAPPPLIPYTARLLFLRRHPEIRQQRLMLDGIVGATWMPEAGDTGILALGRTNNEFVPMASFPIQGFLLVETVKGKSVVTFPPGSDVTVPLERAWECLKDMYDLFQTPSDGTTLEKWHKTLLDGPANDLPLALFVLLNAPGEPVPWTDFGRRLAGGALTVSPGTIAELVAEYAPAGDAPMAMNLLLRLAALHEGPAEQAAIAAACARIALRAPGELQADLLKELLAEEWTGTGVLDQPEQVWKLLAPLDEEAQHALLSDMLQSPARFPMLRREEGLAAFWRWTAAQKHPELSGLLRAFLESPTSEMLGVPFTREALSNLTLLAETLLADIDAAAKR